MATAETASRPEDRHSRKRPFAAWMKRLANLKSSSSESNANGSSKRHGHGTSKSKKQSSSKNNPYPASGQPNGSNAASANGHLSFSTPLTQPTGSVSSFGDNPPSALYSSNEGEMGQSSNKSAAPTLSTNPDTVHSEAAYSKAGTNATLGGALSSNGGGGGSTFSSPAPSVRSLTTTLTTIQSTAPSALLPGTTTNQTSSSTQPHASGHSHTQSTQSASSPHFSHQFPTSPPASAVPAHLAPQAAGGQPTTYTTATANNLLTDNASILTLASSSKRRRRHSLDTDASVRALAPSSLWGGSRESLPLSVLSGGGDQTSSSAVAAYPRPSVAGVVSAERASLYSSPGVAAPALSSERNSYYAGKAGAAGATGTGGGGGGDAVSVRSGLLGHGRNDSTTGSIGGGATPAAAPAAVSATTASGAPMVASSSPLASPRDLSTPGGQAGRISRRSSGWGEVSEEGSEAGAGAVEEGDEEKTDTGTGTGGHGVEAADESEKRAAEVEA
ncbi:MAG: hypothetical protein M1819_005060 [Sarea resinae]|nr:MAG: hypothetical protein M1819_005060 [Sarea resinae]